MMFVLWIATFLLASSPELHNLLHSDAQSPNHHCLITQVKEHALFATGPASLTAILPVFVPSPSPVSEPAVFSSCDCRLAFGRAPPSFVDS